MNKSLILVVEDDTSVKNLITTTLKAHDYHYLVAPDGAAAILEASSHNPDIVLLDLGLPDMDGVEVIQKIRTWSNMPIIVISARSEDTDKIDALDAGADDYLTKPFSVEELLARLRVTQRRLMMTQYESPVEASTFTNGQLRIDYAAGCAYLNEGIQPSNPATEVDKAVAKLIVEQIPNGACLQLGIGGMPNTVGCLLYTSRCV